MKIEKDGFKIEEETSIMRTILCATLVKNADDLQALIMKIKQYHGKNGSKIKHKKRPNP